MVVVVGCAARSTCGIHPLDQGARQLIEKGVPPRGAAGAFSVENAHLSGDHVVTWQGPRRKQTRAAHLEAGDVEAFRERAPGFVGAHGATAVDAATGCARQARRHARPSRTLVRRPRALGKRSITFAAAEARDVRRSPALYAGSSARRRQRAPEPILRIRSSVERRRPSHASRPATADVGAGNRAPDGPSARSRHGGVTHGVSLRHPTSAIHGTSAHARGRRSDAVIPLHPRGRGL